MKRKIALAIIVITIPSCAYLAYLRGCAEGRAEWNRADVSQYREYKDCVATIVRAGDRNTELSKQLNARFHEKK